MADTDQATASAMPIPRNRTTHANIAIRTRNVIVSGSFSARRGLRSFSGNQTANPRAPTISPIPRMVEGNGGRAARLTMFGSTAPVVTALTTSLRARGNGTPLIIRSPRSTTKNTSIMIETERATRGTASKKLDSGTVNRTVR